MTSPALRTQRLLLEPYTPADEEAFVALFQTDDVVRWMGDGRQAEADDRAMFHRVFGVYESKKFDVWAVRLAEGDGAIIGHAEIKRTDTVDGHEVIYALVPAVWGGGLGTELARALVAYGFDVLGLDVVHATVDAANEPSLKVLKRLGFAIEREIVEDDGTVVVVLGLPRD